MCVCTWIKYLPFSVKISLAIFFSAIRNRTGKVQANKRLDALVQTSKVYYARVYIMDERVTNVPGSYQTLSIRLDETVLNYPNLDVHVRTLTLSQRNTER